MDLARRIIQQQEVEDPQMKKLTELQKGRIAYNYIRMNNAPNKYQYYKRFIDNDGDIEVPGFNPISGKYESRKEIYDKQSQEDLFGGSMLKRKKTLKSMQSR